MISILIATKDRAKKLGICLDSILLSTHQDYEVLILDQSKNRVTQKCVESFHNKKIRYIKLETAGKSKAINKGLSIANGEIISLTDDDCVVDRHWLRTIDRYFIAHPKIMGVFGRTLPFQPKKNPDKICPATFNKLTETITSDPREIFCTELGQGNNVSYRKKIFHLLGGLNESFGPGAKIPAAEDVEFIYRVLTAKYSLAYTPTALIYHNRWVTNQEEKELMLGYTIGVCAAAIYSYRQFHNKKVLQLIKYKIHEHITSRITPQFRKADLIVLLRQIAAIVEGGYLGFTV